MVWLARYQGIQSYLYEVCAKQRFALQSPAAKLDLMLQGGTCHLSSLADNLLHHVLHHSQR